MITRQKRTSVIFGKRVSVDDVEAAVLEEFGLNKILPLPLQNSHSRSIVPALCPHVSENIGMRLDDHVLNRPCRD